MPRVLDANFDEILLLPPSVEDWIPAESPARFIREFVAGLDAKEFELHRANEDNAEGRPSFSYALLWRVWLYGYLCRIRSTRKLEAACRERVDFIWLSGNLQPDHNTLWRFWQSHRKALRALFKRTVKVACELNLVGLVLQAIDGTKIQAVCHGRRGWDEAGLKKALERLDAEIAEHEKEIAREGEQPTAPATLPPELANAQELRAKVAAALAIVQSGETRYCHPQETDPRRMKGEGGSLFSYNAQAVVNGQERIITAAEVVTAENDLNQLNPMLEQSKANTGAMTDQNLADGGYCSGAQIMTAQAAGYAVWSPVPGEPRGPEDDPYHVSRFQYDAATDTVICPQGNPLEFRRERERNGATAREYRGVAAVCRACPAFNTCTKDRHGRTVERWPWTPAMTEHRAKMATPEAAEIYSLRSQIVEPVFGWIKEAWSFRRWTWRGMEKVQAQWQLICATSNLHVIYRAWLAFLRPSRNTAAA